MCSLPLRGWQFDGGVVAVRALHQAPAQVVALAGVGALEAVDLLPRVHAHVRDPQVAGHPVEAPAPRVAHAAHPDLGAGAGSVHVRVVRGDRVPGGLLAAAVGIGGVDAQELAEDRGQVLGAVVRVAGVVRAAAEAAVAHADPEVAVRPEEHVAAPVEVAGLVLGDQVAAVVRVGAVGVVLADAPLVEVPVVAAAGVGDVEQAASPRSRAGRRGPGSPSRRSTPRGRGSPGTCPRSGRCRPWWA